MFQLHDVCVPCTSHVLHATLNTILLFKLLGTSNSNNNNTWTFHWTAETATAS